MRQARIKEEGEQAFYHCMSRCVRGLMLLKGHEEWLYDRIAILSQIFYVNLHYVTIMGNHYHILYSMEQPEFNQEDLERRFELLQTTHVTKKKFPVTEKEIKRIYERFTDLSCFMKEINEATARKVNKTSPRQGTVWGDRFKSVLIEDERGLFTCMSYIAMNPVRAGIVDNPTEYPHCSTGRYAKGGEEKAQTTPAPFELLGMPTENQQALFTYYISCLAKFGKEKMVKFPCEKPELKKLLANRNISEISKMVKERNTWIINSPVLGSPKFCEKIQKRYPTLSKCTYPLNSELYTKKGRSSNDSSRVARNENNKQIQS